MITEEQRIARKAFIGSSDMAAILGVSPFASAHDIWLEKTDKLENDRPMNAAMDAGNWMEAAILNFAEAELGALERSPDTMRHPSLPIGSHADAIALDYSEPVEAKNIDVASPLYAAFGEPGSDQIPEYTIIQSHVHMLCMGVTTQCHVPVCLGGRFAMFRVPFNKTLAEVIGETAERFWSDNVIADIPPDDMPSYEYIKRVRRASGVIATVDVELVSAWTRARDLRLAYEKAEEAHKAELLAAMRVNGEYAELADFGDPDNILTFKSQNSAPSVDFAALKKDKRYATYVTQGTHRVLRTSKRKD